MSAPTFLKHVKFRPQVDEGRCIRCGACVRACGTGALAFDRDGGVRAGSGLCRNCRSCVNSCGRGALVIASWFDGAGSALPDQR